MRVRFDANIFISYLLQTSRASAVRMIVEAALAGRFTLLVSNSLLEEFTQRIATKKYLAQRITMADLALLTTAVTMMAERLPTINEQIPALVRDPKDDYLLAYALIGQADYLVTGDADLLTLGMVEQVTIVTPTEFLQRLQAGESPAAHS